MTGARWNVHNNLVRTSAIITAQGTQGLLTLAGNLPSGTSQSGNLSLSRFWITPFPCNQASRQGLGPEPC